MTSAVDEAIWLAPPYFSAATRLSDDGVDVLVAASGPPVALAGSSPPTVMNSSRSDAPISPHPRGRPGAIREWWRSTGFRRAMIYIGIR
ncbi:hypothetical protein PJI17_12055 [Mycobacterium kansasii]|uniref:Uncharacterized protein n=1 Tax=Mycobacterium kansasii TaxID=1768 RepID=A0A653F5I1_MYCKA|nr:hypothetical protein MKSMC1_08060 [Mycobacterium kansasii]VAZ58691.1 hypothetical protein LAUMK22_00480 [Mycobacterium kansasii]VAZ65086.1 hypothetical protein LAUMK40_01208 [Mycobacterium kansasii]VAZ71980.1 hypothetical protein LAUMK7_01099 [Mycobacterium kansasii]VTP05014.1 hypothetical protein BIN_B_04854 [Mycobacterium kansasii]